MSKKSQKFYAARSQGGDTFPEIDTFVNTHLTEDDVLVKMHPSKSGFFTSYDDFAKTNGDAQVLSQGLQVTPWFNDITSQFEYRQEVHIFQPTANIDTAYSKKTLANNQYGEGHLSQIYIPEWEKNKELVPLRFIKSEKLRNYVIPDNEAIQMDEKNDQHLIKRDLFFFYKVKDLAAPTDSESLKKLCDSHIGFNVKDLSTSIKEIGNQKSVTYDKLLNYLYDKTKVLKEPGREFRINKTMELKIDKIFSSILEKLEIGKHESFYKRNIKNPVLYEVLDKFEKTFNNHSISDKLKAHSKSKNTANKVQNHSHNNHFEI